jgi:hypothetical protein
MAGGRAGRSRRSHRGGFADRDNGGMHGAVAAGWLDGGRAGREIAAVLRRAGGSLGCGMHGGRIAAVAGLRVCRRMEAGAVYTWVLIVVEINKCTCSYW